MPSLIKKIKVIGNGKGISFTRQDNKDFNIELGKKVKVELEEGENQDEK